MHNGCWGVKAEETEQVNEEFLTTNHTNEHERRNFKKLRYATFCHYTQ